MADYASIAGGSGEPLSFSAVPGGVDAFYHIDSSRFLDLSARTGDSTVDATGQDHGMILVLGHGSDAATTGDGDDVVLGGGGTDTIVTGAGDDFVLGNGGADVITLGTGNDIALGGTGDDTLYGQAGDDTLFGDQGDDFLAGGAGDDLLVGGVGADMLSGGAGNDVLFGGTGADTLIGGAGDDFLTGGNGGDTFIYGSDFGRDVIADFGASDKLQFAANINGSGIEVPADLVQFISGGAGVTKIIIGQSTITLQGVDKNDFIAHLNTHVQIV